MVHHRNPARTQHRARRGQRPESTTHRAPTARRARAARRSTRRLLARRLDRCLGDCGQPLGAHDRGADAVATAHGTDDLGRRRNRRQPRPGRESDDGADGRHARSALLRVPDGFGRRPLLRARVVARRPAAATRRRRAPDRGEQPRELRRSLVTRARRGLRLRARPGVPRLAGLDPARYRRRPSRAPDRHGARVHEGPG